MCQNKLFSSDTPVTLHSIRMEMRGNESNDIIATILLVYSDFSSDANNYACAFMHDQAAKTEHLHNLWRHPFGFVRINVTNRNQIKRK